MSKAWGARPRIVLQWPLEFAKRALLVTVMQTLSSILACSHWKDNTRGFRQLSESWTHVAHVR